MVSEQSIPTSNGLSNNGISRVPPLQGRTSGPTRRSTKGQWTPEEDEILCKAVEKHKGKNWKKIAESFKDRTDVQCLHRWQKVLNPELVKGPWSKEEDEIIIQLVKIYGPKKWSTIAQHLHGRIGKQCRERWHNHLNPAINKEAWTQEEELILIHAHQIHGNRWAELTKYLPGRSDNAIKNHWNSSVKKKLDSYLASGLLSNLPPPHQPMPSPSPREQASGEDSGPRGAEMEEISECSQESAMLTCSRSATALQSKDEVQCIENPSLGKVQSFIGKPCSGQFYSLKDVDMSISEVPNEVGCFSKSFMQNFTIEAGPSASSNCQSDLNQSHNISSLHLGVEQSSFSTHPADCNRNNEVATVPFQASAGLNPSNIMKNIVVNADKLVYMPTDDGCCEDLFTDAVNDESFPGASHVSEYTNLVDQGEHSSPFLCQPSNMQMSEYHVANSSAPRSCHQLFLPLPSVFENMDSAHDGESNQFYGIQEQGSITEAYDGFLGVNESASTPCDNDADETSMRDQVEVGKDLPKLVPVNNFISGSVDLQSCSSKDVKSNAVMEQEGAGALCYEPPRFPSLDIPFFSCDLIQSGSDMQQDFSPLGIRQLMSSVNCISPLRLWDSPSRDDSPDAALKIAAKTFAVTPSILKKRNRDMLSPLSDRRFDKKLETDSTASLTKGFSRLDVIFNENVPCSAFVLKTPLSVKGNSGANAEEKENMDHALELEKDKSKDGSASLLSDNLLEKDSDGSFPNWKEQWIVDIKEKTKVYMDVDYPAVQQPSGALVELDANDMQLSPDQDSSKTDKQLAPGTQANQHFLVPDGLPSEIIYLPETASGNPGPTGVGSPKSSIKMNDGVTSVKTISSAPLETIVDDDGKDTGSDYFSLFDGTPFKRSIDSPSAWKSPWLCKSLLSSPNITIEDFGFLVSPGDRIYDAIGLMKQVSEHTAAAYAEALEVLGTETPETLSKERHSAKQNQENLHEQLCNYSNLSPNVMTECRVLDFSECETPEKGVETPGMEKDDGNSADSSSLTSQLSYLLKSCR